MKKSNILIVIMFCFFLFCPSIIYWFISDRMDNKNYENRKLHSKPELTWNNIVNFPREYENYFNDYLPFKNEIRKTRSNILYDIFKTTTSTRVIYGKDGWLFYNSVASEKVLDSISDYRKNTNYTNEDMNRIKKNLLYTENELNKLGIDFYIIVLPNKENVYSDYMPKLINRNNKKKYSKTEELLNYLKNNTNLNIVYPKDILVESRDFADTYYKYDTHWNNYGAYLGTIELVKMIEKDFMAKDVLLKYKNLSGDLATMNLMNNKLQNMEPYVSDFLNNANVTCKDENKTKICLSNGLYEKTVLLVGDSFRTAMIEHLSKIYSKTIFVHRDDYKENLVKKYKPDIVICEAVERISNALFYSDVIVKTK